MVVARISSSFRNRGRFVRPLLERLEARLVFASDFGDGPLPYKTLLAEGGAEHVAIGPMLGASRDSEADGVHSTGAVGDDNTGIDDEDGVTFGTIRAGKVGVTATVNVQGGPATLDAWIDFNRDGSWGGPLEQIADRVAVATGNNTVTFDVPGWAADGTAYARFRLSTAGNLGVGGVAADGEVEDYAVTILAPKAACGCFSGPNDVNFPASGAESVYADDVDGDGDIDVLSASTNDDRIAWYENDGSQNFVGHTITTSADGASRVFALDVDTDGDTDVLSASFNDDKIAWYENNGSQKFTAHIITTGADGAESVFAADVDGDGDIDVLFASALDNTIAWYENDGNQNFSAHTVSSNANFAEDVFATDLDNDGDIDILSASASADVGKIAWYENDGAQNFTAQTISFAYGVHSVFATDLDGDGDMDVLSAASIYWPPLYLGSKIAWYENDGNQNFTAHTITTDAIGAWSVYAEDVDGDNDIDVLSASAGDDKIAWYENEGNGIFTARVISTAADVARSVFAADVDQDGHTDVLSASAGDSKIAWYRNDGSQYFAAQIINTAADGARSVFAADVDGDGDNDVLSASEADNKIAWYENDGSQNFTTHTISTAAYSAQRVFAADVDGDGDTDVLSASWADDKIAWYENDGNQNFTTHTITTTANGAVDVFAADMDGDGDMDVLSASSHYDTSDNKIAWYENDGSQSFTAHTITTAVDRPTRVLAADMDGDGDMDVLSASASWVFNENIAWYENDGNQNFTAHTLWVPYSVSDVSLADVDRDGDVDIVAAAEQVIWYENNGSQNFTPHAISNLTRSPSSVYAADIDGDGDTDVLTAIDQYKVTWYANDGSQSFSAHTIGAATDHETQAIAADVDGDGDLDVLSASRIYDRIVWYENRLNVTAGVGAESVDPIIVNPPLPAPPGPARHTLISDFVSGTSVVNQTVRRDHADVEFMDAPSTDRATSQASGRMRAIRRLEASQRDVAITNAVRLLDDVFAVATGG